MLGGHHVRVAGMPDGTIHLLDSSSRDSVRELIEARGLVDVIIPRGGTGLITFVVEKFGGAGDERPGGKLSHLRDESADLDMADEIVINAKTQRPPCATQRRSCLSMSGSRLAMFPDRNETTGAHVELRGDEAACRLGPAGRDASCY